MDRVKLYLMLGLPGETDDDIDECARFVGELSRILPIALALGAGSESRVSMGIAVIGGLLCGGALTLYVIPAMYVLMHWNRKPATTATDAHVIEAHA